MIELRANFPRGRTEDGTLTIFMDGVPKAGPWPCSGRAAGDDAARHGNPTRDPRLPYGDHPLGTWSIVAVEEKPVELRSTFGRWFVRLKAVDGEALEGDLAGRDGIGIHSGSLDVHDLDRDGQTDDLRRTHGCLRTLDGATEWLATAWAAGLLAGARLISSVHP